MNIEVTEGSCLKSKIKKNLISLLYFVILILALVSSYLPTLNLKIRQKNLVARG